MKARSDRAMPRLGIGLPVRNGERYLAASLDALLAQSFEDFEIVISDNASTDRTEEIGRAYAARDGRITYQRNTENIGAAPNFNRTFHLSRGEYFKWAAADDLCAPTFLERCVERLDRDAGVVLAYPRAKIIDENSQAVDSYTVGLTTDSADPVKRFQALLKGHKCFEVFGVIRRSALSQTRLIGSFSHGDGVLLAHLGLLGRFAEVPEELFFHRRHASQSMAHQRDRRRNAVWFDARLSGKRLFPFWRMLLEFFKVIRRTPLSVRNRLRCYRCLWRWARQKKSRLRGDLAFHLPRPGKTVR